jgi:hypothetical protein
VKAGAAAGPTPDNDLGGNCGSSWIYETAIGGLRVSINTGFTSTLGPAVDYWWHYYMRDGGGLSDHTFSGTLAFRTSWSDVSTWPHLTAGDASSWVDPASMDITADGFVCYSAGPESEAIIY